MKILLVVGSTLLIPASLVVCGQNGPKAAESAIHGEPARPPGIPFDNTSVSPLPFTLNSTNSQPNLLGPSLPDSRIGFQETDESQKGNDFSEPPSSYLKPALFVGGALATTGALILTDQTTYNVLHRWRTFSDPLEDTSPVITNLGDGRASAAIFGGFLAYSYLANNRTALQAGKIGIESFLVSGIVTQILKHTFGRQRPSTATQSGGRWNGAYLLLNQGSGKRGSYAQFDAFPSGHTATIFAAATTLAEVYHNSPWVSYISYAVASNVAISRVMERTHWLSDCFVGGLIGYFSTQVVLHFNHLNNPIALRPVYDGESTGLALNVSF